VDLTDDSGRRLDAEYLVEPNGGHVAPIMESRSGTSRSRAPRKPDCNRALTVLLARLGALDAVLADALVDSRHTQTLGLPETGRRLIAAPVRYPVLRTKDLITRVSLARCDSTGPTFRVLLRER
jgi:hypothetical protein